MESKRIESNYGVKWVNDNGELHREDGPAVEFKTGYKEWWINGKLHREDGPAVEYTDGDKSWYLNGIDYNLEDRYKEEVIKLKLNRIKKL